MKVLWLPFFFILLCISCKPDSSSGNEHQVEADIALPNTPTQVAQEWVEAFYSDDFHKAVRLGTDNTRMMIDSVKAELLPDATNIAFKIYNMHCESVGDSSLCSYTYEEDLEEFQEFVQVLRVNGQWLVDESWEQPSEEELDMENMIQEELDKVFEDADEQ